MWCNPLMLPCASGLQFPRPPPLPAPHIPTDRPVLAWLIFVRTCPSQSLRAPTLPALQGSIIGYPAVQTVENLEPNVTYFVGVQGIGSPTASYTISATIDVKPYVPPTAITVDDDFPVTTQAREVYVVQARCRLHRSLLPCCKSRL